MGFYGLENPNPNTPQFAFPRRGGNKLSGTAIVHTAEMYGALNTAAFCMRRTDYGCYHTIVDDKNIIEVYPYEYETWQDSETNNWAVGISAACRAADWNAMGEAQREGYYRNLAWAAADFVVYMRAKGVEVPRRRISGQEARNRVPGFCAHGDSGISRSDPGVNFDWARFFRYIEEALSGSVNSESGDNELDAKQSKMLEDMHARVFGRDVQRWMNPSNGEVSETGKGGYIPLRSTDLHDVLTLHNLINGNTEKILEAVKAIPGVDTSTIDALGAQLKAELEEATKNLKVTLEVTKP